VLEYQKTICSLSGKSLYVFSNLHYQNAIACLAATKIPVKFVGRCGDEFDHYQELLPDVTNVNCTSHASVPKILLH
jgi:hypothetical protein